MSPRFRIYSESVRPQLLLHHQPPHHRYQPLHPHLLNQPPSKMKYTMTAVLVAALAAIPSVIAAPAAVATLLPAKYTLKVSTPGTSATPIQKYLGQVTVDDYAGGKSTKSHICLFVQCN